MLVLDNVSFGYPTGQGRREVLRDIHLSVAENEFVAIMGFSGSGKSTLMALLAGLLVPDRGEVRWCGKVNPLAGPDRGVVFQNYSLLPWLTVAGNIDLVAQKIGRGWSSQQRRAYVQRYIDLVNLTGSEGKRPQELSGGMRQRLSLARTLAMQPKVLLLDEPLSALDTLTRSVLQDELLRIWEQDRRTVVLVTNDVDEAVLMADRIIPLTPGPPATLGAEYPVLLSRPRNRELMNFDPAFKRLRNELTCAMRDSALPVAGQGNHRGQAPQVEPDFRRPRPQRIQHSGEVQVASPLSESHVAVDTSETTADSGV